MRKEQWKPVHVTHDGKIVDNSVLQMQIMREALKRGYDETTEITGYQYLQTEYTKNEDEYLVSGAQLKCTMTTTEKMTIEGREYIPENPSEITYLECEENLIESGEGKVNATTKDCVAYKNIKPFRCNCKVKPCDAEERDMLLIDESCLTEGTCKALIDLNDNWENYPAQVPHLEYEDERFGQVSGITMMSMLFCKHGGLITPITSGQEIIPAVGKHVGFLAYGAKDIVDEETEGYFRLYDGPTVEGEGREYYFSDIYDEYGQDFESLGGALQAFGGEGSVLNDKSGQIRYEGNGDGLDTRWGTLMYKGVERHAIALGPALQNTEFTTDKNGQIKADDMIYGTCVDITICLKEETYYIPAVVVDVKAHTYGSGGYFQTFQQYRDMSDEERQQERENYKNGNKGNIVEWYVEQYDDAGNNKSKGLYELGVEGGIIIYDGETMARNKK